MSSLRSPRKRRRTTRASIAAEGEETSSKRVHLDLENPEGLTNIESEQEQSIETKRETFEAPRNNGVFMEDHTEQPNTEQNPLDPQGQSMVEQRSWAGTTTQHGVYEADASSAAASYAYMMGNWADPGLHLRIQSLPILENLAVQILETLAKGSYQETLTIVAEPESLPGQAYSTLRSLFDHTKKLYCAHEPFLSAANLNLHAPEYSNIIRKANLATFFSSVFGSQDVGFYHLNEYFLETFVPYGGRLLKSQGGLYLDLKTQAYISAMSNGERSRDEILEDLFPADLEARLISRRPGAKQLTPSEVDFVKRARSRRDHLLSEPDDKEAIAALPDKYVWEDFLRDISGYVSRNLEELIGVPASKPPRGRPSAFPMSHPIPQHAEQPPTVNAEATELDAEDSHIQRVLQAYNQELDEQRMASQNAAESMPQAAPVTSQQDSSFASSLQAQPPDEPPAQGLESRTSQEPEDKSLIAQSFGGMPDIPYHTQSAPTQVLYERARLAATAKASPNNRRAGLPSQRRPWTTEEENALMAGLDRVKGPHWSQILAMFGAGGTINESLKDRNQVQLKDKARNLKLFFLKSGIEVPYYLQFVTGELKTRAPGQAAKNEAKAEARMRGDEDKAHVEGVLALAGGPRQGLDDHPSSNEAKYDPHPETPVRVPSDIIQHLAHHPSSAITSEQSSSSSSLVAQEQHHDNPPVGGGGLEGPPPSVHSVPA